MVFRKKDPLFGSTALPVRGATRRRQTQPGTQSGTLLGGDGDTVTRTLVLFCTGSVVRTTQKRPSALRGERPF